jgi:hypothetical protein
MGPKVYYICHNSLPVVLALSQISPIYTLSIYFLTIGFNITVPSMLVSSRLSVSFRFCNKICAHKSHLSMRAILLAHLILIDLIFMLVY